MKQKGDYQKILQEGFFLLKLKEIVLIYLNQSNRMCRCCWE